MPDQALLLEFHERLERLGEGAGLGTFGVAESEVDQVEYVEPEGLEVVVDLAAQIFGSPGRGPATLLVAGRAHLAHDVKRLGTANRANTPADFSTSMVRSAAR